MTAVSFEDITTRLSELLLVDVRTREEVRDQGQIPGSHVLPLQELKESMELDKAAFKAKYGFEKLSPDDTNVVITCRSGRRVGLAQEVLKEKGFDKLKLYNGSFLDWKEKGGSYNLPGNVFKPEGTEAETTTKEAKDAAKEAKDAAKEAKDANKEAKDSTKETKDASKETKDSANETKGSTTEVKSSATETKDSSKETKDSTSETKGSANKTKSSTSETK